MIDAAITGTAGTVLGVIVTASYNLLRDSKQNQHDAAMREEEHDHDRRIRSADDLRSQIDAVAESLDDLRQASIALRDADWKDSADLRELRRNTRAVNDAVHAASARIARLGLRPWAGTDALVNATKAAESYRRAAQLVDNALLESMLGRDPDSVHRDFADRQHDIFKAIADGIDSRRTSRLPRATRSGNCSDPSGTTRSEFAPSSGCSTAGQH